MTLSNTRKVAMYKGGVFSKYGYPNRYLDKKVDGLVNGILFYLVEDVRPEPYNHDQFYENPLVLELTEDESEFEHILIAYQKYEVIEYSEAIICDKIGESCEEYIESNLPLTIQTSNITRFMYLDMKKMAGEATDEDLAEMAHLNDLDNWAIACRALKDERITDYKDNGVFPDLTEWPEMPL